MPKRFLAPVQNEPGAHFSSLAHLASCTDSFEIASTPKVTNGGPEDAGNMSSPVSTAESAWTNINQAPTPPRGSAESVKPMFTGFIHQQDHSLARAAAGKDVQAMFRVLKEERQYHNLHQDPDGRIYALCCYRRGANTARDTTASAPSFTAACLRRHLTKTHFEDLSDYKVVRSCRGPPLSEEDVRLIYNYAREETSVRDRVTIKSVPKIKWGSKSVLLQEKAKQVSCPPHLPIPLRCTDCSGKMPRRATSAISSALCLQENASRHH